MKFYKLTPFLTGYGHLDRKIGISIHTVTIFLAIQEMVYPGSWDGDETKPNGR
jgi:hypothetical protein